MGGKRTEEDRGGANRCIKKNLSCFRLCNSFRVTEWDGQPASNVMLRGAQYITKNISEVSVCFNHQDIILTSFSSGSALEEREGLGFYLSKEKKDFFDYVRLANSRINANLQNPDS